MSQIVIIFTNGLARPHFVCDRCKCPIDDFIETNLIWEEPQDGHYGIYTEIHCKDCDHKHRFSDDPKTSWQPLEAAWFYLGINSKIDYEHARKIAYNLSAI